jgi:transposase-like protein
MRECKDYGKENRMPQIQLPIFPDGVTHINGELAFKLENNEVVYFNGSMPVFTHDFRDVKTFRMITSQFCVKGNVKQADIARAFGIPAITVKRAVKKYREEGVSGFYKKRKARKATVLTEAVLLSAQQKLDSGKSRAEAAKELGVNYETFKKAVVDGRLKKKS